MTSFSLCHILAVSYIARDPHPGMIHLHARAGDVNRLTCVMQQEEELVLELVPRQKELDVDDTGLGQVGVTEPTSSYTVDESSNCRRLGFSEHRQLIARFGRLPLCVRRRRFTRPA